MPVQFHAARKIPETEMLVRLNLSEFKKWTALAYQSKRPLWPSTSVNFNFKSTLMGISVKYDETERFNLRYFFQFNTVGSSAFPWDRPLSTGQF